MIKLNGTEMMQFIDPIKNEMMMNSALRDRRIFLNEEVDRESIFKVVYLMDRIVGIDNRAEIKMENRKPIELIIDSYGGTIHSGLSLISKIESLKDMGYKVYTTVNSIAMSMGFMILLVGSERRGLRHSRVMLHQPSSATWGVMQNMKEDVEETIKLWDRLKEIIIKYTKITEEQLEDIKNRKYDWYMWSEEAIELGVIDKII